MTTSAREQSSRLADLLRREHAALADFLVALADFDQRRLWAELGHASLFAFLNRELGLSSGAAFYRKTAAEVIQRFPEVIEPLRDGRLCFTSIVELSKVLTPENRDEVLPRFFHCSKREAKQVSAEIRPEGAPAHRVLVTPVRAQVAPSPVASGAQGPSGVVRALDLAQVPFHPDEMGHANSPAPAVPLPAPASPPGSTTQPLTADLSRLHLTVSRPFLEKLKKARAALAHSHPGASEQEVLEAGLDLLIERAEKRKGLVKKPRNEPRPAKTDHVPAHVRRAVWKRDGGKCQWPLEGGGVCGSTHQVELDHIMPRALGGLPTVENTRLLCRVHNQYAARRVFGDAFMDGFKASRARGSGASPRGRTPEPFDRGR